MHIPKIWVQSLLIFSFLFMLILLPGCAEIEGVVDMNWQGKGTFQLNMSYPDYLHKQIRSLLTDLTPTLESRGYQIEFSPMDLGEHSFRLSTPLPFQQKNLGFPENWLPQISIEEKEHWWTKEYLISANFDWSQWNGQDFASNITSQLSKLVKPRFVLKLPISASASNATRVEQGGKRLSWDLSLTKPNQLEVQIRVPHPFHILLSSGAIFLLITLYLGWRRLRHR